MKHHNGTIFAVDSVTGAAKFMYLFHGSPDDGAEPAAPLANVNGVYYGTTTGGGAGGTIYKVTPYGQETMPYSFKGSSDGAYPNSGLIYHHSLFYGVEPFTHLTRRRGSKRPFISSKAATTVFCRRVT